MIDILLKEYGRDDVQRYLRRGIAHAITKEGITVPFYIREVRQSERTGKYYAIGSIPVEDQWSERYVEFTFDNIDFTHPEPGLYNADNQVFMVKRYAARQWNFIFNENSYSIATCNRYGQPNLRFGNNHPRTHEHIIKDYMPSFNEAVKEVNESNRYTCAFSRKFWVGIQKYSEDLVVGFEENTIIGKVNKDNSITLFKGFEFLLETLGSLAVIGGIEDAA